MMEPRVTTPRPSTSAPVNISVYKVTDNAGNLWAQFKDTTTKLWQVQIGHDARPSVTVSIVNQLNDFLKENARASPGLPDTVQKLQTDADIKLVIANTDEPVGIGSFVQYRVAF